MKTLLKTSMWSCVALWLLTAGETSRATDFAWSGLGSTNTWSTMGNWTNNAGYPNALTDLATIVSTNMFVPPSASINLDGDCSVQSLVFAVTNNYSTSVTNGASTLTVASGGAIRLNVGTTGPNNQSWSLSTRVNLAGDAYIQNPVAGSYGRVLTVSGQITNGVGSTLYLAGTANAVAYWGTVISGNNTNLMGSVVVTNGGVGWAHANAFGTNSIPVLVRDGGNLSLNASPSKPITYSPFVAGAAVKMTAYGNSTLSSSIMLTNNPTLTLDSYNGGNTRTLTLNGAISGTGNLRINANNGGTAVTLGGTVANTFTGTVTITRDTLVLNKTAGLDAIPGDIVIGDGDSANHILQLSAANQINDLSAVRFGYWATTNGLFSCFRLNGQDETVGGLVSLTNTFGTVENNHATTAATLTVGTVSNCVFSGVFRNGAAAVLNVVKTNAATFYANMPPTANVWTGSFTVNGGTLGGTGVVAAATLLTNNAAINPGTNLLSAGTLTISNHLVMATNAVLNMELGRPGFIGLGTNDLIAVASNLTFAGTVNVTNLNGFETAVAGNYWVLMTNAALTTNTFQLGTVPTVIAGATYTLDVTTDPTQVRFKLVSIASGPTTPTYTAPADTAVDVAVTTNLSWNTAGGADGYDVYLWITSAGQPALPSATNVGLSWDPPGELTPITNYSWMVVATNASGATTGAVWTFTTTPVLPASPATPSPSDGATGVVATATLDWADSARAQGYQMYLWTNGDAQPLLPSGTTASSQWTPPFSLSYSTTYAWQVVGTNSYGGTTGSVWTFTTRSGLPDVPGYIAPTDTATGADPNGMLSWSNTYLAAGYEVRLWLTSGSRPASPTATTAGTSWSIAPQLQFSTQYSWEIVATNAYGSTTGTVWTFTTGSPITFTWDGGGGDNNWDTPLNWTNDLSYPQYAYDTAVVAGTVQPNINLNGDRSIKNLFFTNTTVSMSVTNSTLTVGAGGALQCDVLSWPNGTPWTIRSNLRLLGDAYIRYPRTDGNRRIFTISGGIVGSNTLYVGATTYDGSWVNISGNNTGFVGTVVLTNGAIGVGHANCFGTNSTPVEIRPNAGGSSRGVSLMNPADTYKSFKAYGNFSMEWGFGNFHGPIELVSNATVYVLTGGGNACRLQGAITGTGNTYLELNSELGGSAANTYAGSTLIAGIPVYLNKTAGQDAVPGPLLIGISTASGRVQLSAANQINDSSVAYLINTASRYGALTLNGNSETIGGLVTTGGVAQTAYVENSHGSTAATLTINNAADGTYAGMIRNGAAAALSIIKSGAGTWCFNGIATNTGTFTVSGGTLGGTGTIASATTVNTAALAPGTSAGTLTIANNLALNSGTVLNFELGQPGVVGADVNDLIDGVAGLTLDGTLNVTALYGFSNAVENSTWRLINYTGSLTNNALNLASLPAGYTYAIDTSVAGQVNLKVTAVTLPPGAPSGPVPTNGAINVGITDSMDWDNSPMANGYQIYLWKAADPQPGTPNAELAGNGSSLWDPPIDMDPLTAYNWQIVATNSYGATTGSVWTFTTASAEPDIPASPSPTNGATLVRVDTALDWGNASRATGYQVFLWLTSGSEPGTPTATTASSAWTPPSLLTAGVSYSWRIIATNTYGSATGAVWTFTTMSGGAYTWDGGGADNKWDTLANWVGDGGYPYSINDSALIRTNATPVNINLNGNQSLASLTISPISEAGFSITNNTLTLAAGGFIRLALTGTTGPNNQSWSVVSAVNLLGDARIENPTGGGFGRNLTVSGQIAGAGTLTLGATSGSAGYWGTSINGNNTNFTGSVIVTNGAVVMGNVNAFGTNAAAITVNGGALSPANGCTKTIVAASNCTINAYFNPTTVSGSLQVQPGASCTLDSNNGGNTRPLTINGVISGAGNIRTFAGNTLTIAGSGANTYTGTTTITAGTLYLNKTAGLDAVPGNLIIGDGDAATHAAQLSAANQISDAGTILFGSSSSSPTYSCLRLNGFSETVRGLQSLAAGYGTVENASGSTACTLTLSTTTNNTFSGVVRDGSSTALSVVVDGTGAQYFNGTANNTGTWTVNGGTLGGTGTIASATTVNTATLAPGASAGAAGTMTVNGNLSLASGTVLQYDLGTPGVVGSDTSDLISVTGNLALNGTVNVTALPSFGAPANGSTWRLINYTGTRSGSGLTVGTLPAGYVGAIDLSTSGQVNLRIRYTMTIFQLH